jgi:DNA-binding CsgD family transcriptional regulator
MIERRALALVEKIYDAVVEPDAWNDFLALLSDELGGAAIQLSLRLPGRLPTPENFFSIHLYDEYHPVFVKHIVEGLPWSNGDPEAFRGRFGLASEVVTQGDPENGSFYADYMEPQGLSAEWPVCHMIAVDGGRPLAGVVIYRRDDCREISNADLAMLDSLVPHLQRAYALHCELRSDEHERRALTEVIDRFPTGVMLFDADGTVVLMNRSAEKIIECDDGFRLKDGHPHLADPRQNRLLQELLRRAATSEAQHGNTTGQVISFERPSGKRPFSAMVGPLVAAAPDMATDEARALLFIADPDGGHTSTREVLEELYELTRAEADLVRLVSEGRSLEEVAQTRGVTINTVRSQLKQVFSKTDTSRQGELVHLVLSGVASLGDTPDKRGRC